MKGVIQRVYNSYRRNKGLPPRSVKLLSEEELQDIYKTEYWDRVQGDKLPVGLDYCVFDFAVNSGPSRSIRFLQRAINKVGHRTLEVDGLMGPATLDAVTTYPAELLITRICDDRLGWLQTLKTYLTFGKGWRTRVLGVKRDAVYMLPLYPPTAIEKPPVPASLGLAGDVKPKEVSLAEKAMGVLSVGGAGLLGVVNNPYTLTLALVLVVLTAGWIVWKYK